MLVNSPDNLPENVKRELPDVLHDAFTALLNKNYETTGDETMAYMDTWISIEKMQGTYSSMRPNKATQENLKNYMDKYKIPNQVPMDKLHSTVMYSRLPIAGYEPIEEMVTVHSYIDDAFDMGRKNYFFRLMGENNKALALCYGSERIQNQFWDGMSKGGEWPHPDHDLHITLSYDIGDFDVSTIKAVPDFDLVFEKEVVEPLAIGWSKAIEKSKDDHENEQCDIELSVEITKVDSDKRLVYGWASVIEVNGEPLVDRHNDIISEDELVKAAHNFIRESRRGDFMHEVQGVSEIVESFCFTKDVQKALGIDLGKVGWMICTYVHNDAAWDAIKKGLFPAFSIGGKGTRIPVDA